MSVCSRRPRAAPREREGAWPRARAVHEPDEALRGSTIYAEFAADFRTVDSALHRLQTSVQALIDVGSYVLADRDLGAPATSRAILELLEAHGHLPPGSTARFGPIFGFGNRVVHLYDRIDPEIVYRILVERRGDLAELADLLLAALEQ